MAANYRPTLSDVGALLRDRTVDVNGTEQGTFTVDTSPNATQADSLIDDAMGDAYIYFGTDIPDAPGDTSDPDYDADALRNAAKRAVGFHAASLIELSHFGEQVARGNSPYAHYEEQWTRMSKQVATAIESATPGTTPGASGDMNPHDSFPADAGGMIGWGTRW